MRSYEILTPRSNRPSYTYVIQAENGGPVKIGTSIEPQKRLRMLQIGNPQKLRIIKLYEESEASEAQLHKLCQWWRIHGEWYEDLVLEYLP